MWRRIGDYKCAECDAGAYERRKPDQDPRDNVQWVHVAHWEHCSMPALKEKLGIREQQWV